MAVISIKDFIEEKGQPADQVQGLEISFQMYDGIKVFPSCFVVLCDKPAGDYAKLLVAIRKAKNVLATQMVKDGGQVVLTNKNGCTLKYDPFGKCKECKFTLAELAKLASMGTFYESIDYYAKLHPEDFIDECLNLVS